jgi:hypothetical protein
MKPIKMLIMGVIAFYSTVSCQAQTTATPPNPEYRFSPTLVTLTGTVRSIGRASADGTTSATFFVLVPTQAIDVVARPTDTVNKTTTSVVRIQLLPPAENPPNFRSFVNKKVTIVGALRSPYTDGHYTPVVVEVKRIR